MGSLHFDITGDNSGFIKALKETVAGIKSTSKEVEQSGMNIEQMFGKLTKAASGLGIAFSAQQFISQIASVRGEFQQLEVAFETMLGSTEKATALMNQLTETAAVTPFDMKDVAEGAKQLLAYGLASEKVNEMLVRLGDIAAGLSIPLNDLVYLYGTTMTQGKMFTQDLRQFQGRGIPLADELAKQFGVTKDKVAELVTQGRVGFKEMEEAIVSMTSEGGKFGGLMEAQSKTISGQIRNIEDAIDQMFNELGKSSEGVINTTLSGVSVIIENYEKLGKVLLVLISTYGAYKASLMALTAIQKTSLAIDVINKAITSYQFLHKATKAQTVAQLALNAASKANPYVLLATAVVAVGTAIWGLAKGNSAAEKAARKFREELEQQTKAFEDKKSKVESLIGVIQSETETEYAKAKAYDELKSLSPSLVNAYNREEIATLDLAKAVKVLNEEREKEEYNTLKNRVESLTATLRKLEQEYENYQKSGGRIDTAFAQNLYNSIITTENNLKQARVQLTKIEKIKREAEENSKPIEVRILEAKAERDQIFQEYLVAKKALEDAQAQFDKNPLLVVPFNVEYNFKKSQEKLEDKDKHIKNLEDSQKTETTYKEAYKKAEKEWKAKKKAVEDAKKKNLVDYENAKKELEVAETTFKSLGGDVTGKKDNKELDNRRKIANELLDIERECQQAEIDLMKDGAEKREAQIELDYQRALDKIKKQKEEWLELEDGSKGVLSDEQYAALGMMQVQADTKRESDLARIIEEEKTAMLEYLKDFGNYEEKRKGIIGWFTEKINKATTQGEKLSLKEQMTRELADLDTEIQGKTNIITQLFDDMSNKTVEDMRKIANAAQEVLTYLNQGKWVEKENGLDKFGFTKEQFETLVKSPEKLKAIKDEIFNVNKEADDSETALNKMSKAFKELTSGNTKNFEKKIGDIINGVGAVTQAAEFLGDSLGVLSEAFGGNFLGGIAEGIGVATDAANAAMSGAQAGAVFGPWGAAAGAAIGAVSSLAGSLSKLHDKKHERKIQKLAEQIETLEKSYEVLGEKIEDAYSNDASNLIEEQNKLLEQQKILIQNQIKEEESKKKTDNNRIKDWKEQIEDINKTIEDNKESAVDAIFGSDLKSAIEDFSSAYADAWSSGSDKRKAAKDVVKNMIKDMISESVKAAASDPMKAIREKLLQFWSDQYISGYEQEYLYKMAEDLQNQLDQKYGWADGLMDESTYNQEASSKGFQSMSQDTADELNGRFTALQISNEEIKNQMIQSVVLYTQMLGLASQNNGLLSDILTQHAVSNGYLADIAKYSKIMSLYGEKIDKIVENTKNL